MTLHISTFHKITSMFKVIQKCLEILPYSQAILHDYFKWNLGQKYKQNYLVIKHCNTLQIDT